MCVCASMALQLSQGHMNLIVALEILVMGGGVEGERENILQKSLVSQS